MQKMQEGNQNTTLVYGGIVMAVIEYIKEARCLDCKYYVPAPKPFANSMCGLKEKPTNRKDRVCKDWEYKY